MKLTRTLVALSGAALLALSSAGVAAAQEENSPTESGSLSLGSLGSSNDPAQEPGEGEEPGTEEPGDEEPGTEEPGDEEADSGSLGSLFGPAAFAGSNYGSAVTDPTQTGSVAEWLLDWSQGSTITSNPEEDTDPDGAPVVGGSLQAGSLNLQGSADAGLAELGAMLASLPGGSLDTGSISDVINTESLEAIDNVDIGTLFGS